MLFAQAFCTVTLHVGLQYVVQFRIQMYVEIPRDTLMQHVDLLSNFTHSTSPHPCAWATSVPNARTPSQLLPVHKDTVNLMQPRKVAVLR